MWEDSAARKRDVNCNATMTEAQQFHLELFRVHGHIGLSKKQRSTVTSFYHNFGSLMREAGIKSERRAVRYRKWSDVGAYFNRLWLKSKFAAGEHARWTMNV